MCVTEKRGGTTRKYQRVRPRTYVGAIDCDTAIAGRRYYTHREGERANQANGRYQASTENRHRKRPQRCRRHRQARRDPQGLARRPRKRIQGQTCSARSAALRANRQRCTVMGVVRSRRGSFSTVLTGLHTNLQWDRRKDSYLSLLWGSNFLQGTPSQYHKTAEDQEAWPGWSRKAEGYGLPP